MAALVAAVVAIPSPGPRGVLAAETRPPYGGQITATLLGEPAHLDPVAARTHAELTLASLVFDTLYQTDRRDPSGHVRVVPHLAQATPAAIDDGRAVRVALRPGLRFHDGSPLTARDVARSLRRLQRSDAGWLLADIADIAVEKAAVVLRARAGRGPLSAADIDELTLALSAPMAAITREGEPPDGANSGSGPFRLVRIDRRRQRVVLDAYDDHVAGRPFIDRVTLRWYQTGTREAAAYEVGNLTLSQRGAIAYPDHRPKYDTREATGPATVLVYAGVGARSPLASPAARRALDYALDRDSLRGIGTGERVVPTDDPVPTAIGAAADAQTLATVGRPRMDRARQALAQARRSEPALDRLLTGAASGATPAIDIVVDQTRPDDREVAENVAAALFRLGIAARVNAVSARELAGRVASGRADLYIGQLALPAASPVLAWAAAFAAGGQPAWARRAVTQGRAGHAALRRRFADTLPLIPLFHRAVRVHHRSDLRGVSLDDTARLAFADLFLFGRPTPHPR